MRIWSIDDVAHYGEGPQGGHFHATVSHEGEEFSDHHEAIDHAERSLNIIEQVGNILSVDSETALKCITLMAEAIKSRRLINLPELLSRTTTE